MPPPFKVSFLPHGLYPVLPAVMMSIAWLASLLQEGCEYARLTGDIVPALSSDPDNPPPYLEVGYAAYREPVFDGRHWTRLYTGSCLSYPQHVVQQDGFWKVAKGFNFLAVVLGGSGTFMLWFSVAVSLSPCTWRWAGFEVASAVFLQAFSFLWFQNSMCHYNNCSLFVGSVKDVVATVLWAVSSLMVLCYYPAPRDMPYWNTRRISPEPPASQQVPQPDNQNDNNNNNNGVPQQRQPQQQRQPRANNNNDQAANNNNNGQQVNNNNNNEEARAEEEA